jgi:hypothetical protein
MSVSKLEVALAKLRDFRPSLEKVVRRLTEYERMVERREQEQLILLCAQFANALEEAGRMAELRRRNSLLLRMTRPDSQLAEYRRRIISHIIRYQRGSPEIYDCEFGSEPESGFAPIGSLFSPHAVENALDDCRRLEQLGWEDGDWGIDLLDKQLWNLKRKAQKYHLWGIHIIMTCYRAHRPELGDRDLFSRLHTFLPDLHECAQAVQEAAEDIVDQYSPQSNTRHSVDFRSVVWFGIPYTFTPNQAACVRVLWEAWENATPEVGQETILAKAGAEGKRLSDVFKRHPAWGALIVQGSTKGTYRFQKPDHRAE